MAEALLSQNNLDSQATNGSDLITGFQIVVLRIANKSPTSLDLPFVCSKVLVFSADYIISSSSYAMFREDHKKNTDYPYLSTSYLEYFYLSSSASFVAFKLNISYDRITVKYGENIQPTYKFIFSFMCIPA
jgi:hypothetical protein